MKVFEFKEKYQGLVRPFGEKASKTTKKAPAVGVEVDEVRGAA